MNFNFMIPLGNKIKSIREENNVTQRVLANQLDIDVSILSKIENNQLPKKNMKELIPKIAEFFNLPEIDLQNYYKAELVFEILRDEEDYRNVFELVEQRIKYQQQNSLIQEKIQFQ